MMTADEEGYDAGYAMIPRAIQRDETISMKAKMVYITLSSRANARQQCWPSQGTIAKEAGMSVDSVQDGLAELRSLGLVSWQIDPTKGRPGQHPNRYTLTGGHPEPPTADSGTYIPPTAVPTADSGGDLPLTAALTIQENDTKDIKKELHSQDGEADDQDTSPVPLTAPSEKTPKTKTGSGRKLPKRPLPDDWTPNEGHRRFAQENDLDVDLEAARFRAYWLSVDGRFVRWDQTFTNRLMSLVAYRAERQPPTQMWGNGASRPAAAQQTTMW